MGVSYSKLVEKFIDKGYIYELHLFIGTPPPFIPGRAIADSIEKERERIAKEKIQMEKEISRLEGKLSNQGFLAKAPEAVVAKEKEKLEEYKQKQQALLEREAFLETL